MSDAKEKAADEMFCSSCETVIYVGRMGSGIAMILLGWLTLGIWPLIGRRSESRAKACFRMTERGEPTKGLIPFIDIILILCGKFKDSEGKFILQKN